MHVIIDYYIIINSVIIIYNHNLIIISCTKQTLYMIKNYIFVFLRGAAEDYP